MWIFSRGSYKSMMAQWWPNDSTSKAFAAIWSVLKRCAWLPRALAASCSGLNLTFSESGDVWGCFLILVNVLVTFGDLLMILVICWWLFVLFFNDVWCFFMILGDCLMILDHLCHPSHWWLGVPQLGVAWKGIYNWISKDPKGSQDSIHLCILYCGISFQNFDDPLIAWKRQGLVRTSFREKIVFYSIPSDDIHPHRYPHEIGFPWLSPAQPGFGQGSAACVAATPSVPELFVVTLQGCCGSHGSRHCHWPSQNDCCHLHYPLVN